MLKYGLLHGLLFTIFAFCLGFLTQHIDMSDSALDLIYLLVLFIPLMVVGYRYKAKVNMSPFLKFQESKGKILLYPFGVAIFTATLSAYGAYIEPSLQDAKINVLVWLMIFGFGLVGQTLKLATVIFVGSWFKKINP